MPPKYSHVKKRSATGLLKPGVSTPSNLIKEEYDPNNPNGSQTQQYHHHIQLSGNHFPILGIQPNTVLPTMDKNLSQAMTAVAHLERAIARLLLLRFEWDIARLYSTRIHSVSVLHIPILVAELAKMGGPGWAAMNADSEEIKDFYRAVIGMDMREAGERVATKSVLWSYTALRRFALAHNVEVCPQRGLQSLRLLPHYPDLKDHLDTLEARTPPIFEKPACLGGLDQGFRLLEETCISMGMNLGVELGRNYDPTIPYLDGNGQWIGQGDLSSLSGSTSKTSTAMETRIKLRMGYTRMVQSLWRVAREFDVRGYGQILREKLTIKWCECGCSTENLGEVCERAAREEEEDRERDGTGIWGGGELTAMAYAPSVVLETPPPLPPAAPLGRGKGKGPTRKGVEPPPSTNLSAEDRQQVYARLNAIKEKELDGRGSGVYAWDHPQEEDIWEVELDFGSGKSNRNKNKQHEQKGTFQLLTNGKLTTKTSGKDKKIKVTMKSVGGLATLNETLEEVDSEGKPSKGKEKDDPPSANKGSNAHAEEEAQMTIGEIMEWRYIKAESEKEMGNNVFRKGQYEDAVAHYKVAFQMEPEMPRYQLNLAAAYLKLNNWIEAENACTSALAQHRSSKGLFRRAKARKEQGKYDGAISDYRALIRLQPQNTNAMIELLLLLYPSTTDRPPELIDPEHNPWNLNLTPHTDADIAMLYEKLGIARPKRQKPLPFEKSKVDDIKLKIVAIPPAHPIDKDSGAEAGSGQGRLKSGKSRGKEKREEGGGSGILRGTAADYGVVLLAWDRYHVVEA